MISRAVVVTGFVATGCFVSCFVSLFVSACDGAPAEAPPTYATVKPFIDAKCGNCHRPDAIAPMSLLHYDEVKLFAADIRRVIDDGTMPPWLAVDGCNEYLNDNRLSDDEKKTLFAWLDDGAPEGAPEADDAQALEDGKAPVSVVRPDLVLDASSAPYEPRFQDEYRCYAIAMPAQEAGTETYITGFDVLPGDPSNVHHVNVFMNPPVADAPDWVGLDDEDPLAGYDCESERVITSFLVGAWAPGASGLRYPKGSGQLVEPGSVMVLEVHYAVGSGVPDLTQVVLETAPSVERRGLGVAFWKFQDWEQGGMEIAAGDVVTHSVDLDPGVILAAIAPWLSDPRIEIGLGGLHMHALGTAGELSVLSPVGDTCMVQVNKWDFRWQFGYELKKPVEFFVGEDKLHLECTWDNSQAHQPYVDGVQQEVRDRNWGHRTSDEMCMGFLYLTEAPAR